MTCRIASCYVSHCWRYYSEVASHAPCCQQHCQQFFVLPARLPAMPFIASEPATPWIASDVASNSLCRQQNCQRPVIIHPCPSTSRIKTRTAMHIAAHGLCVCRCILYYSFHSTTAHWCHPFHPLYYSERLWAPR